MLVPTRWQLSWKRTSSLIPALNRRREIGTSSGAKDTAWQQSGLLEAVRELVLCWVPRTNLFVRAKGSPAYRLTSIRPCRPSDAERVSPRFRFQLPTCLNTLIPRATGQPNRWGPSAPPGGRMWGRVRSLPHRFGLISSGNRGRIAWMGRVWLPSFAPASRPKAPCDSTAERQRPKRNPVAPSQIAFTPNKDDFVVSMSEST
jgi:hypothetical protein